MNSEQMLEDGFGIEAELMRDLESGEEAIQIALEKVQLWRGIWASRSFHSRRAGDGNLARVASKNYNEVIRLRTRIETIAKKLKEAKRVCEEVAKTCEGA